MTIGIGTQSAMKIRALEKSLARMEIEAEIVSIKADSGIPDQPFGYGQIATGARNRAKQVLEEKQTDLGIGIENGLIEVGPVESYFDVACIIILTKDGHEATSFGSAYWVPQFIIDEIKEKGTEFGHIIQRLVGGGEKDPMKYFSNDKLKREEILEQAISIALTQIVYAEKYINSVID